MKKKAIVIILAAMMAMTAVGCTSNSAQNSQEDAQEAVSISAGLTVKPLTAKVIDANPYMGKATAISIMTVIIQILRMRYCRWRFIRRSMSLMRR